MGIKENLRLLFRCSGSFSLGMGHLARCSVIAKNLAPGNSLFLIDNDPLAQACLERKGLPFRLSTGPAGERDKAEELIGIAAGFDARTIILDRKDNTLEFIGALKNAGLLVVDFEDRGPGRDLADILIDPHIYPGTPESEYSGEAACGFGPRWAILDPEYRKLRRRAGNPNSMVREKPAVSEITLACGGSDPAGLTAKILRLLDRRSEKFRIKLVSGPFAAGEYPACRNHRVKIFQAPSTLATLLFGSDLALVSGGITMLESLCLGVPTVVVPQHEEQYYNAAKLTSLGALLLTPPPDDSTFRVGLEVVLNEVFENAKLRASLSARGWETVDGGGLERFRELLMHAGCQAVCG